jgi:hypothetical protein
VDFRSPASDTAALDDLGAGITGQKTGNADLNLHSQLSRCPPRKSGAGRLRLPSSAGKEHKVGPSLSGNCSFF